MNSNNTSEDNKNEKTNISDDVPDEIKKEIEITLKNIKQEPISCDESATNDVSCSSEPKKSKKIKRQKIEKTPCKNKINKKKNSKFAKIKCLAEENEDKENSSHQLRPKNFSVINEDNYKCEENASKETKNLGIKKNRFILDKKLQEINKKEGCKQLTIKFN